MAEKIEFKFKSPEDSPGYLLGQLTLLWQRKQKRVLDPLNLTQTQFVLLAALGWLSRENDNVTQVDIANQGNADRMMVSKVLRTLEEKQFISRQEHPTDTRAKVIKLTEAGANVLQTALTAVENADIDFFSVLGNHLPLFNQSMVHLTKQNKEE
ncbi:MarR family transcriptional regulator [Crocinitomicaceae bacterium CZZ-1]|uniref:MarR family transcriptional regulator n=1 Tax=Taishania pollutisoli TaxID=2766479 RepID=A0A8J6PCZ6_9FLAO|nr:MarR family transcriptional regulator [Taishania pollutisoli]MBC9810910.1 MarR family transcriptional regulator [Taishania pollutisoli]MBX2949535.1 MarR family transcriptional regulator [Crocinitomicaceae bacterium]